MKNLVLILFLAPSLAFIAPDVSMSDISTAIKKGDVETLAQYFDEDVEVAVLDDEDVYDKAEAKRIVKSFFTKYQPKGFNQVHQGTSKGKDSQYLIGNLTANGSTFRVYVYMQTSGGKYLIQEIRFDKE